MKRVFAPGIEVVLSWTMFTAAVALVAAPLEPAESVRMVAPGFAFIDTSFENASPLWYELAADGTVQVHLLYDHERSSPNRAAGHFHFQLHAETGSELTLEFKNLDNVWNGRPGSVAKELKAAVVSQDGLNWTPVATESFPGNRVRLTVVMPGPSLYMARVEPYRISDLDRLLASVRQHPLVRISPIGRTVQGRELEIIRVGNPQAPYRVFVRARAHPWESGGNWVVEGLIHRLLSNDSEAKKFLNSYCVDILPIANKDGVARGMTRFNLRGRDLNRNWDRAADPLLAPENHALEQWLEGMIDLGQRPHLALELHNDGGGLLHVSKPARPSLQSYTQRMAGFEALLRKHTWFTEGSTSPSFHNPGTLGDGWLERYEIDAVVHEFNCNWIAGLNDFPSAKHWQAYGAKLADVLHEYFHQFRRPTDDADLRFWLENMILFHGFAPEEVSAAAGLTAEEVRSALGRFGLENRNPPQRVPGEPLRVLPYPGGRHPRLGFFDGAIMPQRDTKVSVFTPWDPAGYVVVDVPEAIFSNLGLTYLAHTHIPTIWDLQRMELPQLEWRPGPDGSLSSERTLPNGIAFGAKVLSTPTELRMSLWLRNGTQEKLTGLRVQNCVLLGRAPGFEAQTLTNKLFRTPYAAVRSEDSRRWVITAWDPVQRCWGNEQCPCLHSDPQLPDCPPGETVRARGWLSFYEGEEIEDELERIEATGWRQAPGWADRAVR